jgi:hypothetical protein
MHHRRVFRLSCLNGLPQLYFHRYAAFEFIAGPHGKGAAVILSWAVPGYTWAYFSVSGWQMHIRAVPGVIAGPRCIVRLWVRRMGILYQYYLASEANSGDIYVLRNEVSLSGWSHNNCLGTWSVLGVHLPWYGREVLPNTIEQPTSLKASGDNHSTQAL